MNSSATKLLAIVVPAYKADFLRETLESIAGQTSRDFALYVFDDCSPGPIGDIVREFEGKLPMQYHRFPENMGGKSLVKHWERCLRLTSEPWIWLFSDDDMMDAECVAAFQGTLGETRGKYDAYRFNTTMINDAGRQMTVSAPHPDEENGPAFLLGRWRGERNNFLQELIFSREAWEAIGGIPEFPLAWHSDDGLTARLGMRRPIKCIPGPRVNWRWSGANITSDGSRGAMAEKIRASSEFIPWAMDFFGAHDPARAGEAVALSQRWFFHYVSCGWHFLSMRTCWRIEKLCSRAWGWWPGGGFLKAMRFNFKVGVMKVTGRVRKIFVNDAKNPVPDESRS